VPPGVAFMDFELASIDAHPAAGQALQSLYEDDRLARADRHCFLRAAELPLMVRLPADARPAQCQVRVAKTTVRSSPPSPPPAADADDSPALFHVTHWKAGSQWIYAILRGLFPSRIVPPMAENYQVHNWPLVAGGVYPTIYATKAQFDQSVPGGAPTLIVIRDPRDTLISYYFSLKFSHAVTLDRMAHDRELVRKLSVEDGLLVAIEYWMQGVADIQSSWLASHEPIVRYEDLVRDDFGVLKEALIDRLRLPITEKALRDVTAACRFERLSGGRRQGDENNGSHYRKGVSGDWRNHFTPRVTAAFKQRFGDLLIAGGYERDRTW
jgi:lipopolysaccharide transport system ATP-binding protein